MAWDARTLTASTWSDCAGAGRRPCGTSGLRVPAMPLIWWCRSQLYILKNVDKLSSVGALRPASVRRPELHCAM
eukprot:scaffold2871_cov381-Prasinococcus_capsulatus_cf.AAC.13